MIQNVMRHLGGIEGYGLLSILFFMGCFIAAVVWAWRLKRSDLDAMARLPLESDPEEPSPPPSRHE